VVVVVCSNWRKGLFIKRAEKYILFDFPASLLEKPQFLEKSTDWKSRIVPLVQLAKPSLIFEKVYESAFTQKEQINYCTNGLCAIPYSSLWEHLNKSTETV
jgi:hypothetical protein